MDKQTVDPRSVIGFIIDGGGSTITTGVKGGVRVPWDCTVTGWEIASVNNTSGSIVVDVWRDTYANLPPTALDSIAGTEKPTISSSTKGQDTSLSTWTVSLSAGDWLYINVDSVTSLTLVSLSIQVTKA